MILEKLQTAWNWAVNHRQAVFGFVVGFVLGQLANSALALEQSVEVLTTEEGIEAEVIDAAPPVEESQDGEPTSYNHTIKRDSFVKAYTIVSHNSI